MGGFACCDEIVGFENLSLPDGGSVDRMGGDSIELTGSKILLGGY